MVLKSKRRLRHHMEAGQVVHNRLENNRAMEERLLLSYLEIRKGERGGRCYREQEKETETTVNHLPHAVV
jgi:hypothetical protein